jgi:anti-sigma regulatory factor (Ser/Thr protein kinase)
LLFSLPLPDAAQPKAYVTVEYSDDAQPIDVSARSEGERLSIEVRDRGIGIARGAAGIRASPRTKSIR